MFLFFFLFKLFLFTTQKKHSRTHLSTQAPYYPVLGSYLAWNYMSQMSSGLSLGDGSIDFLFLLFFFSVLQALRNGHNSFIIMDNSYNNILKEHRLLAKDNKVIFLYSSPLKSTWKKPQVKNRDQLEFWWSWDKSISPDHCYCVWNKAWQVERASRSLLIFQAGSELKVCCLDSEEGG